MNVENKTFSLMLVALFAALSAIGAFIVIPVPVVPFTLQIIFVLLAANIIGKKLAFFSQAVYIFVGLAGVPVFANGGGVAYVLQPTFGYVIGFAVAAYVVGAIIERYEIPKLKQIIVANLFGTFIIYVCGAIYMYIALNTWLAIPTSASYVIVAGMLSTIFVDFALAIFTSFIAVRMYPIARKYTKKKRGIAL